jgi:hypothetical protein
MRFVLHAMLLSFAVFLAQPRVVDAQANVKQIRLTEKQVQGFISAQKDMVAITRKMSAARDKPDSQLNQELKAAEPVEYPSNIDLVLQYYDKIEAALQ